jgi:hypothetical protein
MIALKVAIMIVSLSGIAIAIARPCTSLVQTTLDRPLETTAAMMGMIAMLLELRHLLFVPLQVCTDHNTSKDLHLQSSPFVAKHHLPFPQLMLTSIDPPLHNPAETTSNKIVMAIGRAKAEEAIEVAKAQEWPQIAHSSEETVSLPQS